MKRRVFGLTSLLVCTMIWGTAFIAQSVGMDQMGPFTFQCIRCLLAVAFLFPVATLAGAKQEGLLISLKKWTDPMLLKYGLLCGSVLFIAASLQQIGLVYTDAGKAGFITAMYIVLVPILGIVMRRKPSANALFSVIPAIIGLYMLCGMGPGGINIGDIFLMGGALGFSVQIMLVDKHAQSLNSLRFNCAQCIVICLFSFPMMLTEERSAVAIWNARGALLYAGIMSMGVAYTLQVVGQKHVEPTAASIILSLESVFAALAGWALLHETMNPQELMGCCLMFLAVVLSQLPTKHKEEASLPSNSPA